MAESLAGLELRTHYILNVPELQNKLGPGWDRKEDVNGNVEVVVSLHQTDGRHFQIRGSDDNQNNKAGPGTLSRQVWAERATGGG
ncbi:hypothetical protein J6590_058749 [Homalodisca vitripennis]|nr:hypothetical protein J6590_058749 [Homalodisca vitripennis]